MSPAGAGRQLGRRNQVFLNVPYDSAYANVFVALVAAVVAAGRFPRCTLEVPSLTDRRDRIFKLIESCGASIHDITIRDRLNMPFELGFAFAVQRHRRAGAHSILVLNESRLGALKRLSDLNGMDVHAHGLDHQKAAAIVLGQLGRGGQRQPTRRLDGVVGRLVKKTPRFVEYHHADDVFELPVFEDLRYAAIEACEKAELI